MAQNANPGPRPNPGPGTHPDPGTYFAAERTLLAWIRTGLALMGFGFVVARFGLFLRELQQVAHINVGGAHTFGFSLGSGVGLVLLGVSANALSLLRYRKTIHQLNSGKPTDTEPSLLGTSTALLLALLGLVIAFYLLHEAK